MEDRVLFPFLDLRKYQKLKEGRNSTINVGYYVSEYQTKRKVWGSDQE
jgi:hypothetical protein